jgi:hypothetical protein
MPSRINPYLHVFVPPVAEGGSVVQRLSPAYRCQKRHTQRESARSGSKSFRYANHHSLQSRFQGTGLEHSRRSPATPTARSINVSDALAAPSKNTRDQKVKSWIDIAIAAGYQSLSDLSQTSAHRVRDPARRWLQIDSRLFVDSQAGAYGAV